MPYILTPMIYQKNYNKTLSPFNERWLNLVNLVHEKTIIIYNGSNKTLITIIINSLSYDTVHRASPKTTIIILI